MRIGIYPVLKREDGGVYQYTVTMLRALHDWVTGRLASLPPCPHDFTLFAQNPTSSELGAPFDRWRIVTFRPPWSPSRDKPLPEPYDLDRPVRQWDMHSWMEECGVELMLYPSPHRLSFEAGLPFVMPIHDLQHRLLPQFPEVRAEGEWERREYLFRNAVRQATLLLVDSLTGEEDVLRCYSPIGVTRERLRVLPFLPACRPDARVAEQRFAALRAALQLPERYLFYPAQFWPHKNHRRLIEALGMLAERHGLRIPLMLTGSHHGALRDAAFHDVMARARELGVADQVRHLGYVCDDDVTALYSHAAALVMPTFFGPTNIPVLEAWACDCPVVTSAIRGISEQCGDAALLVDPRSAAAIADGILRVWSDDGLGRTLIERGRRRLAQYTYDDYTASLTRVIDEAASRVAATRTSPQEQATCR